MKLGYFIGIISLTLSLINLTSDSPSLFGAITLIIGLLAITCQYAVKPSGKPDHNEKPEKEYSLEIYEPKHHDYDSSDGGSGE